MHNTICGMNSLNILCYLNTDIISLLVFVSNIVQDNKKIFVTCLFFGCMSTDLIHDKYGFNIIFPYFFLLLLSYIILFLQCV